MSVLFRVGSIAVAVLEIEPEVLDRLTPELLDDAGADRVAVVEAQRARQRLAVRRMLVQRLQRQLAKPRRGVAFEEVGTAVDGVHRLPIATLTGIGACECQVGAPERRDNRREIARR